MRDKRQAVRHEVALPALLKVDGKIHDSEIANLSLGGALVSLAERLPMNQRVEVTFSIPSQEDPLSVTGLVRWSTGAAVGIQFDGLRAREVWSLNRFFESLRSSERRAWTTANGRSGSQ